MFITEDSSVDRWTITTENIALHSKKGEEKIIHEGYPIREVLHFNVTVSLPVFKESTVEKALENEMNIRNFIRTLFVMHGEKCLTTGFLLEQFKNHFSEIRFVDVEINKLEQFYTSKTTFRGKETNFSSQMTNLLKPNTANV